MTESNHVSIQSVFGQVNLVVFQTRMISVMRETGSGEREREGLIKKEFQKCFDPQVIRPFNRIKIEAGRLCRNYGTKIESMNAWAVPSTRTEELLSRLKDLGQEWDTQAKALAGNLQNIVEEWARKNPTNQATIRALAPTCDDLLRSTKFIFTAFKVSPDEIEDFGSLESDVKDMPLQILYELSQTLKDGAMDGTGTNFTIRSKDVLGRACAKAKSLAFLHPVINTVAIALTEIIDAITQNGKVGLLQSMMIRNVLEQMHAPSRLYARGFVGLSQEQIAEAQKAIDEAAAAAEQAAAAKKAKKASDANAKQKAQATDQVSDLPPDDSYAAAAW